MGKDRKEGEERRRCFGARILEEESLSCDTKDVLAYKSRMENVWVDVVVKFATLIVVKGCHGPDLSLRGCAPDAREKMWKKFE